MALGPSLTLTLLPVGLVYESIVTTVAQTVGAAAFEYEELALTVTVGAGGYAVGSYVMFYIRDLGASYGYKRTNLLPVVTAAGTVVRTARDACAAYDQSVRNVKVAGGALALTTLTAGAVGVLSATNTSQITTASAVTTGVAAMGAIGITATQFNDLSAKRRLMQVAIEAAGPLFELDDALDCPSLP